MFVLCFFATDLHGSRHRYERLFAAVRQESPQAVFLGGDLLPHVSGLGAASATCDFLNEVVLPQLIELRREMQDRYPTLFVILGNDDPRCEEEALQAAHAAGVWRYLHGRADTIANYPLYGYACVPPTPFLLKDWERYDVSRYVPPGCVSPEEGYRTVALAENEVRWGTIEDDLKNLIDGNTLERAILLVHTPPADTPLDRAALDGKMVDHVPLDVHVGSIAVRRFIEANQPLMTLHGHVHESTRLTGEWTTQLGRTTCINGAHDGPELALVRFDPAAPAAATRELL